MTARYALYTIDKLRDRFGLTDGVPKGVKPHYNISPVQLVPVVLWRDGRRVMELMKWGFVPKNAPDTNSVFRYKTFIARSEGIFSKPTWQTSVRTTRCLIPANGFYDWKKATGGKQPFYIHPTDQQLFAYAGLYSSWTDADGKQWGTCSIVTTNSATDTDTVPSRLPVIVHPDDESDWLNPEIDDVSTLYRIMRPYDASLLSITKVNDEINSTKIDSPRLIEPVA